MSLDTRAVVQAAVTLLDREGAGALGFNRLARELRVKPPSLYNHVADDADLRRRVAIEGWARFDEACRRGRPHRSGASAVRAFATAYRAFAAAHPGVFDVMAEVALAPEDPDFAPVSKGLLELMLAPWRMLGLSGDDAVHALRGLRAAVHGFTVLERQGLFRMAPAADQTFALLVEATLDGFTRGRA